MYYFEDTVAEATKEIGLRGVLGETIIGFPVADARTPRNRSSSPSALSAASATTS
jgi:5-methylthioadenosine/S-adenosylhomocysteine deaminase